MAGKKSRSLTSQQLELTDFWLKMDAVCGVSMTPPHEKHLRETSVMVFYPSFHSFCAASGTWEGSMGEPLTQGSNRVWNASSQPAPSLEASKELR